MDEIALVRVFRNGLDSVVFWFPMQVFHCLVDTTEKVLRTHGQALIFEERHFEPVVRKI
jgi:hypothetical protein